jgi:hypothetical protein
MVEIVATATGDNDQARISECKYGLTRAIFWEDALLDVRETGSSRVSTLQT